jgi:uncharacterized protein HemY
MAWSCYSLGRVAGLQGAWDAAQEYLERSLPLFCEIDDQAGKACVIAQLLSVAAARSTFDKMTR